MKNPTVWGVTPFLKWAGGKRQLLDQIALLLPPELKSGSIRRYVEPFIGGGAVFFYMAQNYPIDDYFLYDVNPELVVAYTAVQRDVVNVINRLGVLQERYLSGSEKEREDLFYAVRAEFNLALGAVNLDTYGEGWADRAAQTIFLNHTCFNGLFRVNAKGEFNVPFGYYKNPTICNSDNLTAAASLLQAVHIQRGDFTSCDPVVDGSTFVYFDPPYRPISRTASFTSYSGQVFDDAQQLRLATFFRKLDRRGARLMVSNSDPKNEAPQDNFFEEAYQGFRIERVKASRNINSNGKGRGLINELILLNY